MFFVAGNFSSSVQDNLVKMRTIMSSATKFDSTFNISPFLEATTSQYDENSQKAKSTDF
jgi:delta-aminolevulinic acid dehydratase/porphobilinogen synthase